MILFKDYVVCVLSQYQDGHQTDMMYIQKMLIAFSRAGEMIDPKLHNWSLEIVLLKIIASLVDQKSFLFLEGKRSENFLENTSSIFKTPHYLLLSA